MPKTMHNTYAYIIIFEGSVLENGNLKSGATTKERVHESIYKIGPDLGFSTEHGETNTLFC